LPPPLWRLPPQEGGAGQDLRRQPTFLTGIAMPFGEKIVRFIFMSQFNVASRA
jgi:hypothetical protein